MSLHTWALKWGVSPAALADLQQRLGLVTPTFLEPQAAGKSEAFVQSQVRLEASQKGVKLWRNNSGALKDEHGRLVRYGLANDNPTLNAIIKSADLIGWRPVLIQAHHVGTRMAQFTSREMKRPGWQFNPGDAREVAQKAWADAINADGGDAAFATGPGSL